jgi:phenylalanyl-tRNA synthetase beta chain
VKLPLSWLRDFVSIEADLNELCGRLTQAGLEVEAVEQFEPAFTNVFVAKVNTVERHPNADRLSLCEVDAGREGRFRVVCGARNVRAGMTAALAKVGARLAVGAHGSGSGRLEDAPPLQAAVIRGVPSEGMLCSEMELNLSKDHEGILELPPDAAIGVPLERVLQLPDVVLDIAITPNRGDCLSILGLAREIAALFDLPLRRPHLSPVRRPEREDDAGSIKVEIRAPDLCPRYAALPMSGVTIGPSPYWMRRRLELCGMRALSNVVDITNYVMLELGQPLHAFDASRISDRSIVVRRAAHDREFTTLDGSTRVLSSDDLVIADHARVLAIAGVTGGQNSEVNQETTSLILESAYFEPATIARTARRLGLRSESSYRFERGIDRAGQVNALMRAAQLIREFAGGYAAALTLDLEPTPAPIRRIDLDLKMVGSMLGVAIPQEEVERRLRAIGAGVESTVAEHLEVTAPPFRPDINETADLIEEVARLKGLSEIPAELPERRADVVTTDYGRNLTRRLRELLAGCGLVEARTIAFVAPEDNQRFPGLTSAQALYVANPLSTELSQMRASLLPGLIGTLRFNLNRQATAIHLFEVGKVFADHDGTARESLRVGGLSYGEYVYAGVGRAAIKADFYSLKGVLQTCLSSIAPYQGVEFAPLPPGHAPYLHPSRAAIIKFGDQLMGVVGELHPAEALRCELVERCMLFELDFASVVAYSSQSRQGISTPPRFPAVRRDVALVVEREVAAGEVVKAFAATASPLLESVELFDVFEGGTLPSDKKSVTLACCYRSQERTLTDDEVNRTHAVLIDQVTSRLNAALRSS